MSKTAVEARDERVAEYTTYVATVPIHLNGVRAFNVGDPVPVSHIDRGVVDLEQVEKVSTKAGQAAVAAAQNPEK
jgi:hypothetical protein